jgi:hypothetical protein
MKSRSKKSMLLVIVIGGGLLALASAFQWDIAGNIAAGTDTNAAGEPIPGKASASTLQENYLSWAKGYSASNPAGPVVAILWNKGLSSEYLLGPQR